MSALLCGIYMDPWGALANLIGGTHDELVFTGCATEARNLALRGDGAVRLSTSWETTAEDIEMASHGLIDAWSQLRNL